MDTARAAFAAVWRALEAAAIPEPEARARVIVAHALGIELGDVYRELPVSEPQMESINGMVRRCALGEPVEYVTGRAYFRYLELDVTPDVLIPRQETELVADEAIELIRTNGYGKALDIGTGSGCIAIALATETQAEVDACDISRAALAVAERNAEKNNAKVHFFLSDMLGGVAEKYDIIVSNPPYISEREYTALDRSVRDYEPKLALTAGDGLEYYRTLANEAGSYLNPNGPLVLEIGAAQAADVMRLLADGGFTSIELKKDYSGRDRIVTAHQK